jgi:phosphohistidine phosphatase
LWVLRHGEAERHTTKDPERALTERGSADARAAGLWLAGIAPSSLRVIASPYRRAQQTADAAMAALPQATLTTVDWLTPDFDPQESLRQLALQYSDALLLVSHQPLVSAFISLLVAGHYRAGPPMGTASLAELELSMPMAGCAKLISLRHAPDYRKAEPV